MRQPDFCGGQRKERFEGSSGLVVTGGNPSEVFEPVEHSFDAVAVFINLEIAGRRVFPVRFRRNHWPNAVDQQLFADGVAVVALVSKERFRFANGYGEKRGNGAIIRSLATCQDKAERTSLTVCAGMDFCRKAAA